MDESFKGKVERWGGTVLRPFTKLCVPHAYDVRLMGMDAQNSTGVPSPRPVSSRPGTRSRFGTVWSRENEMDRRVCGYNLRTATPNPRNPGQGVKLSGEIDSDRRILDNSGQLELSTVGTLGCMWIRVVRMQSC